MTGSHQGGQLLSCHGARPTATESCGDHILLPMCMIKILNGRKKALNHARVQIPKQQQQQQQQQQQPQPQPKPSLPP